MISLERSGLPEFHKLDLYEKNDENRKWNRAFKDYFWEKREKLIEENLRNCSKSAWILPLHKAKRLATLLREQNLHSDVGKKTLFRKDFALHLEGFVPSHILRGFARVTESGLFQWWNNFMVSWIGSTDNPEPELKATNMKGNILVIFIVWLAGMVYSLVIFCGEFWQQVCKYTRKIIYKMINVIRATYKRLFGSKVYVWKIIS